MGAITINHQTTIIRPIVAADIQAIEKMMDSARRVHLRIPRVSLKAKVKTSTGFLAEDGVGLRGFIMLEPQPPDTTVIIAAALRDTWGIRPYLDSLLPEIEQDAQLQGLTTLAHIGYEDWLNEGLLERGFEIREWIVNFERLGAWPHTIPAMPAVVRTAHLHDLPAILTLDRLAFDQFWRKSAGSLSEALARAVSFVVAEMEGQIVGYEWCEIYRQHAHLVRLAVHPHYQRRGLGAQLLYQAILDTLSRGVNLITLNTQESNHRSHALYQRFGFAQTDQRIPVLGKELKPSR
ncbi:MAG: GNAT family N-acetyltransferase [Anaerolineae bacterium]|nr:GNAT family N-acetyltransferase [Anaerolineae bacterium]